MFWLTADGQLASTCIYTARQLATCFQTIVGSCATGSLNTWLFAMYLCLPLRVCCWQEGITESFKPKYRLRSIRLCVPWWDGEMTAAAARNAARPLALQGSPGPRQSCGRQRSSWQLLQRTLQRRCLHHAAGMAA